MKLSSLVLEMEGVKTDSLMESLEEQLVDYQDPWEETETDLLAEEGMEIAQIDHLEEVETIPIDLLEEEETETVQTDLLAEGEMETVQTDLLEEVETEIVQTDLSEELGTEIDLSAEEEMETVLTDLLEEVEIIQIDQLEEM